MAAPAGQVELGEPHGAEGKRKGELDQPVHRADQLQAAAADVGHEGALAGQREVVRHRAIGEGGLGLGVDDAERDVQLLPHPADEPGPFSASRTAAVATAAIRRTPRRWQTSRIRREGLDGAVHGGVVEAAGGGEARRQAGLVLELVDDGEAGGGVVLRDEQPDRVGADVDGGDALARPGPARAEPRATVRVPSARLAGASPRSSAWCLIDLPSTRKTTSSPMLVARSATRSRFRLTRKSSMPGADRVRVLHHVGEQDAEHRAVQRVHLVVAEADLAAARGVAPDEGLERVGQHLAGQPGHLDDLGLRRDRPGSGSAARPTGRC